MVSESLNPAPAKVVDMAAYRARRAEKPLPLFDGLPDPQLAPPAGPAGTRVVVALSARQAAHRVRMLRHLGHRTHARQDV